MSRLRLMGVLLAGLGLAVAAGGVAFAAQGDTTRVSVRGGGFGINGDSSSSNLWPLTDDGRLAAQQLASRLQMPADELVVASEELKARQTAEALSDQ